MEDGYPIEAELDAIRKLDMAKNGLPEMVELIDEAWNHTYGTSIWENGVLMLATGGWSGNEEIVRALMDNFIFWSIYWRESKRGGAFWFEK
jgi:hypothetical protein